MNLKEHVRRAVYSCFPEFDPAGEARSWPSVVLLQLSNLREQLMTVGAAVQQLAATPRRGTVVLLAPDSFRGPRFSSQTLLEGSSSRVREGTTMHLEIPLHWPLPAGGWVVSHGCVLTDVFVGNQHQGIGPESNYCQLSDEVSLGVRLAVRVRFD